MLCRVEQNRRLCWGRCCDLPERVQELLRWWNYEAMFRNVLMVFQVICCVRGSFLMIYLRWWGHQMQSYVEGLLTL